MPRPAATRRKPPASAHYLVEANLVGHDSHGVIRVSYYIDWLQTGKVLANQNIKIISENEVIAVVDGGYGLGADRSASRPRSWASKKSRAMAWR